MRGPTACGRVCGLFLLCATYAGAQSISVGENVRVTSPTDVRPFVEPHLAAHPTNPLHLLGAAIRSQTTGAFDSTQVCSVFVSLDGGKSWETHDLPVRRCGDPWIAMLPDGRAVFTALGMHPALPHQRDQGLVVLTSPDGGRTWDPNPIGLGRAHDHETIAVDYSSAKRKGWVYVLSGQGVRLDDGKLRWTVYVARSRDGGRRFDEPFKRAPSNLNVNSMMPAVLSDGTLIVSYLDFQRNVDEFRGGGQLERSRVWIMRSTDAGDSFSIPLFSTERCVGWSSLAADTAATSPYRDRIYVVCKARSDGGIIVHRSADGGETWSDAVSLHPISDTAVSRSTPTVAVNRDGTVAVAWVARRSRAGVGCDEIHVAASLDGGQSFLPERSISSALSCPDSVANGGAGKRWRTGGDYFGLLAAPDGRFHALWADARTRVFSLWTASVDVKR